MYNDKVVEIFSNPKHVGEIEGANATGKTVSASCGDTTQIYLKINQNGVIEDASFKTFGCAAAIASASVAVGMIIGKTTQEALKTTNQQVVEELGGLPEHKVHCSVLAEEAIAAAIENYLKSKN
jgi:nitrogen fixation NifU-like protein